MGQVCAICGTPIDSTTVKSLVCWNCEHDDMYTVNMDNKHPLIIAVDFDGTLCEDQFPNIGKPNALIIEWLKSIRHKGHKIILWTCRINDRLIEAVKWCAANGLIFDAVNDNLQHNIDQYGTNPRKVFADLYIDDKSINSFHNSYDVSKINMMIDRRNKQWES